MVGDNWSPTASMRTWKYLLADAAKHKAIVHQLYFVGAFLQEKVKNRLFVKLDIRYTDYFPEYAKYFRRALRLFWKIICIPNIQLDKDSVLYFGLQESSNKYCL